MDHFHPTIDTQADRPAGTGYAAPDVAQPEAGADQASTTRQESLLPLLLIGGGIAAGVIALVAATRPDRSRTAQLRRYGREIADAIDAYKPARTFS